MYVRSLLTKKINGDSARCTSRQQRQRRPFGHCPTRRQAASFLPSSPFNSASSRFFFPSRIHCHPSTPAVREMPLRRGSAATPHPSQSNASSSGTSRTHRSNDSHTAVASQSSQPASLLSLGQSATPQQKVVQTLINRLKQKARCISISRTSF